LIRIISTLARTRHPAWRAGPGSSMSVFADNAGRYAVNGIAMRGGEILMKRLLVITCAVAAMGTAGAAGAVPNTVKGAAAGAVAGAVVAGPVGAVVGGVGGAVVGHHYRNHHHRHHHHHH